jgi:sortase (surface protein transpeptidase)
VLENRSSCRQGLEGSTAVMVIPSIGYVCPVFRGGQRTIDSGAATWFTGWPDRSEQASVIGGPGTVWMAGHRTSHGAPFLEIPNIPDGADVTFFVGAETVTYRIVGRMMFTVDSAGFVLSDTDGDGDLEGSAQAGYRAIFRDDLGGGMAPRLVLQTCDGRDGRWILYADRVA